MVNTYGRAERGTTGSGSQSCLWCAEQGKSIFPCPRSRLRIGSRETGSSVPSRISPLIFHTQAEYGAYLRDSSRFPRRRPFIYTANRHRVSLEFIRSRNCVYRWRSLPRLYRNRAKVLKVVPVTSVAFSGIPMNQLMCASLFPTPTVGM